MRIFSASSALQSIGHFRRASSISVATEFPSPSPSNNTSTDLSLGKYRVRNGTFLAELMNKYATRSKQEKANFNLDFSRQKSGIKHVIKGIMMIPYFPVDNKVLPIAHWVCHINSTVCGLCSRLTGG